VAALVVAVVADVANQRSVDLLQRFVVGRVADGQLAVLLPEVVFDELRSRQELENGVTASRSIGPNVRATFAIAVGVPAAAAARVAPSAAPPLRKVRRSWATGISALMMSSARSARVGRSIDLERPPARLVGSVPIRQTTFDVSPSGLRR
jgi:hypothetical protein